MHGFCDYRLVIDWQIAININYQLLLISQLTFQIDFHWLHMPGAEHRSVTSLCHICQKTDCCESGVVPEYFNHQTFPWGSAIYRSCLLYSFLWTWLIWFPIKYFNGLNYTKQLIFVYHVNVEEGFNEENIEIMECQCSQIKQD